MPGITNQTAAHDDPKTDPDPDPDDAPPPARPRVVVIGGGFGGLKCAKRLARRDCDVILIDRRNHHLFQPLLYQVASAVLSPADIAAPIRAIFREADNVEVRMGEVARIDLDRRVVTTADEATQRYEYIVIACGARTSYFGHDDDWSHHAPGLKTIEDALELRRRMLIAFEEAELEADERARARDLTFVIVGGGPTGVELAGAIKEIAMRSIPHDYRFVNTAAARVVLVQAGDVLLKQMPRELGERARRDLERMGVEVRLHSRVGSVDEGGVWIGEGDNAERIEAGNVYWAAGVHTEGLTEQIGDVSRDRAGRVKVGPDLSIPGHPEAFVIGDAASISDPQSGEPVPGVAQAAIQMGRYVGDVIREELHAQGTPTDGTRAASRKPFHYRDKGSMATIGKARAVADVYGRRFAGFPAWVLWMFVHILFLVRLRSKVFVFLSWVWAYTVNTKGARLITGTRRLDVRRHRAGRGDEPPDTRQRYYWRQEPAER